MSYLYLYCVDKSTIKKYISWSCNILRFACKKHTFLAWLHHDFPIRAGVWSWLWNLCTSLPNKISNFRLWWPNRSFFFFSFYLIFFLGCLKGTLQQWTIAPLQILRLHKGVIKKSLNSHKWLIRRSPPANLKKKAMKPMSSILPSSSMMCRRSRLVEGSTCDVKFPLTGSGPSGPNGYSLMGESQATTRLVRSASDCQRISVNACRLERSCAIAGTKTP